MSFTSGQANCWLSLYIEHILYWYESAINLLFNLTLWKEANKCISQNYS